MAFKVGHTVNTPIGIGLVVKTVGTKSVVVLDNASGVSTTFTAAQCAALATSDGSWVPAKKGCIQQGQDVMTMAGTITQAVGFEGAAWVQVKTSTARGKGTWHQVYSLRVRNASAVRASFDFDTCSEVVIDAAWKSLWSAWKAQLQTTHVKAVTNYCLSWYAEVNARLRKGVAPADVKYCDRLDAALDMGQTDRAILVWRSASRKFDKATPVGAQFTDPGFGSCTIRKEFAWGWGLDDKVLFEIRCAPGTRGAYVRVLSPHKHEDEFLLPRGARYEVAGRREENGRVVYVVNLIGQD